MVFEHVGSAHTAPLSSAMNGSAESVGGVHEEGFRRKGSGVLAQQGAANAALKLLDDLCMMATGNAKQN